MYLSVFTSVFYTNINRDSTLQDMFFSKLACYLYGLLLMDRSFVVISILNDNFTCIFILNTVDLFGYTQLGLC